MREVSVVVPEELLSDPNPEVQGDKSAKNRHDHHPEDLPHGGAILRPVGFVKTVLIPKRGSGMRRSRWLNCSAGEGWSGPCEVLVSWARAA
jgi:hypothetical protein